MRAVKNAIRVVRFEFMVIWASPHKVIYITLACKGDGAPVAFRAAPWPDILSRRCRRPSHTPLSASTAMSCTMKTPRRCPDRTESMEKTPSIDWAPIGAHCDGNVR
jgi:hypothetical protein